MGVDAKELLMAQPDSGQQALEVAICVPFVLHPPLAYEHSTHELLRACSPLWGFTRTWLRLNLGFRRAELS